MDAYNKLIVVFYYIFCVVVCSLFLLNMTIAVMLNHYEDLEKRGEEFFRRDQRHWKESQAAK